MNGFNVLFAIIIMYFVVKNDWSKLSKSARWLPYLSIVVLSLFVLHNFLLSFGINIPQIAKDKGVFDEIISKIRF